MQGTRICSAGEVLLELLLIEQDLVHVRRGPARLDGDSGNFSRVPGADWAKVVKEWALFGVSA